MELASYRVIEEVKFMKSMCAWCARELDRVERCDDQPLTHGVCPECRRRFFAVSNEMDYPSREKDERDAPAEPGGTIR
jgi:hypothetical protein